MANSTIAQLNSCNPLTGAELVYLDDGTADVKASANIFRNYIYNTAVTINATSHGILLGNSAANLTANATTLQIGAFTANTLLVNAAALNVVNQINTGTIFVSTSVNVGSSVVNSLGTFSTGTINAAAHSTSGWVANTIAINPTSNTILLGNSIGQFVITANSILTGGALSNSTGIFATSNTISVGNTIGRFVITANSVSTQGTLSNATGIFPTSNTIALGNTIGRFVITANSVTTTNTGLITATTAAVNGATYITGGILLQWGWVAANATVGNITFPVAFPTTVFSYNATSNSTVAANLVSIIAANTTTMNVRSLSTAAASNSYWMAVGN